jgi:hypothetical protein
MLARLRPASSCISSRQKMQAKSPVLSGLFLSNQGKTSAVCLLVTQALDGVELGGLAGRENAE